MTTTPDLSAAAAALGRKGGQSTSERKAAASRENGKRGGRPRKDRTMAGYDVLYCGKCGAELPEVATVYRGGPRDDEREVERLACKHQGDGGVTFKYFDWNGEKYVKA